MSQKCLIASYISKVNTVLTYVAGQRKSNRKELYKRVIVEFPILFELLEILSPMYVLPMWLCDLNDFRSTVFLKIRFIS